MKVKYFLLFLIPAFIILLNLHLLIFNYNLYKFENKDVNENLLNYLNNKEELNFNYTGIELIHLQDVKSLIKILGMIVYVIGFLLLLILIFNKEEINNILIISGLITIGVIFILFLLNFSFLFTKFHEILFTNNYWLLNENSLLIKTYPLEFFINFFKRLILNITITSIILIVIGLLKNVYTKYKSGNS